jgi:hypothetical protein
LKRFALVLAVVGLTAAIFAGTAAALRFTDDDFSSSKTLTLVVHKLSCSTT